MAWASLLSGTFYVTISLTMTLGFGHNLNMLGEHSVVRHSPNDNYTHIVDFWEEHKNEFVLHGDNKEVVLVMGNTGAGKTTLILALIGRKLNYTKLDGQAYPTFIDEEGKIGTGVSSKTLVPDIMTDIRKNVTYVDCSGFRDNRDIEYEIASIYFQNILMNQVERMKLILVINYDSLKTNGNKNDFDDLLEHIGEFIKDTSEFHNGIALVATKVENLFEMADNGSFILSNDDQTVLNGIATYLKDKSEIYRSKTVNHEKYQKFANLIDVLLQTENNLYPRIAIFRQPRRQGILDDMPDMQNQINTIASMTINNLHYVERTNNSFGYSLSKSAKTVVDDIVDDIYRNSLTGRLLNIGDEILLHYSQMEIAYSDVVLLQEQVSQAYNTVSMIKNIDEPLKLFQKISSAIKLLNIPVSQMNLSAISNDIEKLQFFTNVSNVNEDLHMLLLNDGMRNITESIGNLKNFYNFLNNLEENLAAYNSQNLKDDTRTANIISSCTSSTYLAIQNITDLEDVVKEIGSYEIYQTVKTLKLDQPKLKHLMDIFNSFTDKIEFTYTSSTEQMTVKGYNIKISDVVKNNYWAKAKIVQVFALNKAFIDCTLDKTGAKMQLLIFAPTWEVVGAPKIILNGKTGENYREESAKSSFSNSENGAIGLPGLPGGPAGNLFGIGQQFINLGYLEIYANGGNGGAGQHGGNGADGINGEELAPSYFKTKRSPKEVVEYVKEHNFEYVYESSNQVFVYYYLFIVNGKPAIKPSDGGDGGVGGSGGYSGRIVVNGLGKLVNLKMSKNSGSAGSEGRGGRGGQKARNGYDVSIKYESTCLMSCYEEAKDVSKLIYRPNGEVPAGKNGKPGNNRKNLKSPEKLSSVNLSLGVNSFKDFIKINLSKNIKKSVLQAFLNKIENNNDIKIEYNNK